MCQWVCLHGWDGYDSKRGFSKLCNLIWLIESILSDYLQLGIKNPFILQVMILFIVYY